MSKEIKKHKGGGLQNNSLKGGLKTLGGNLNALSKGLGKIELPRLYYQLVIFVLDASQSMTWEGVSGKTKGDEVHDQIIPIIKRLKSSKNANSFDVSMFAFSQSEKEFIPQQPVTAIDTDNFSFNPCDHVSNYQTYAEQVFHKAEGKVISYLEKHEDKNCQAMIIVLGDGDFYDFDKTLDIANRLKQNPKVTIASYLLEDKSWNEELAEETLENFEVKH